MKRLITIVLSLIAVGLAAAQDLSLTFTSITDAKFYVYLNGTLQNQRSSGMVTLKNLEDKDYHIRIVIDDPFEVAVTRTIRPDAKHNEYTVQFNAVRERVYLKLANSPTKRQEEDNNLWIPQDPQPPAQAEERDIENTERKSIRRGQESDTATRQILNRIRTQTIE